MTKTHLFNPSCSLSSGFQKEAGKIVCQEKPNTLLSVNSAALRHTWCNCVCKQASRLWKRLALSCRSGDGGAPPDAGERNSTVDRRKWPQFCVVRFLLHCFNGSRKTAHYCPLELSMGTSKTCLFHSDVRMTVLVYHLQSIKEYYDGHDFLVLSEWIN